MKKAFTLIELILVVLLVGIVSIAIVPRLHDDSLHKAAEQIMFHLKYTQHLALMDNRLDAVNDSGWYKTRWQLYFSYCKEYTDERQGLCAYTVFSDKLGHHTGNPDPSEIATNPLNYSQLLTGGMGGNKLIKFQDKEATKSLNLGKRYGIKKIQMYHCGSSAKRVSFDYLGRPMVGNPATLKSSYQKGRLLKKRCEIILTNNNNEQMSIFIEPETGYVYLKH